MSNYYELFTKFVDAIKISMWDLQNLSTMMKMKGI